ncbi:methyltransferase-like protein 22 isoform X1 [Macrobrachium rosenbergii]|uniref:methyltransferase-like protein 22 isoform X1 n=1 Tax=Macrobrachium rosenbergii TaxID=79674 RepID=UPI0034D6E158
MSAVKDSLEDDENEHTEERKIPHTEYTVSSEVNAYTKGEVINGSSDSLITKQDGITAETQNISKRHKAKGKTNNSCECLTESKRIVEEKEEMDDEELFECHLGANGQVVLWSSQRETVLSRFVFTNPFVKNNTKLPDTKDVSVDCDGDLQVVRKNQVSSRKEEVLLIEHQSATTLDLVGEQVWGGALYLADFILHKPDIFEGKHVLELAAGVGLTAIVAAMFAKQVTVTDIDRGDILKLISRNLNRNAHLLSADTEVKEIDFTNHQTIDVMGEHLKNVSVIIVADAIYDNRLTDSFLNTVLRLMSEPPSKTLYLALEKRYVFTLEDMDSVAPCYEYLLTRLDWLCCQNLSLVEWNIKLLDPLSEQYFTYERNKNLIIYEIQARVKDKDITA